LFSDRANYLDFKENFFIKKFIVEEIAAYPPASDVVIRVAKSPPRPRQVSSFAEAAERPVSDKMGILAGPRDYDCKLLPSIFSHKVIA